MYRNGEQIVAARGYGWDRGEWEQVSEVIKGAVWWNYSVSWLWWSSHQSTHTMKWYIELNTHTHTQMHVKLLLHVKIWKKSMDSCNSNFLVMMLCNSYDRYYDGGYWIKVMGDISVLFFIRESQLSQNMLKKKDKTCFLRGDICSNIPAEERRHVQGTFTRNSIMNL